MRTIIDNKVYDVFCTHCDNDDDVMLSGHHIICPKCDTSRSIHPSDQGRIGAGPINAIFVEEELDEEETKIAELERRIELLEAQVDILCDEIGME